MRLGQRAPLLRPYSEGFSPGMTEHAGRPRGSTPDGSQTVAPRAVISTVVAQVAGVLPPGTRGLLVVTAGADIGRVITIPDAGFVSFGRSEDCTVQFDDVALSRVH